MAYVFDQLNQALQPSSTNVFGSGQSPQQAQGQQSGTGSPLRSGGSAPAAGGSPGTATTSVGASSVKDTGVNQPQAPVDQTGALSQNYSNPGLLSGIQSQQSAAKTQLQNEANTYLTGAQNQDVTGGVTASQLTNAGTDSGAASAISSRLSQTQAPQAAAYTSGVNLQNPNLTALQSPSGLQTLLKTQGGSNYTSGEATLDQMLLGQNSGFQAGRAQALATQQALQQQQAQHQASLQNTAQKTIQNNWDTETGNIKTALGSDQTALLNAVQPQLSAYNNTISALNQTPNQQYITDQEGQALQAAEAAGKGQNYAQYLIPAQAQNLVANPNQYYAVGGPATAGQYLQQNGTLAQYNQLAQLLGQTNMAGGTVAPNQSFNQSAYEAALVAQAQQLAAAKAAAVIPYTPPTVTETGPTGQNVPSYVKALANGVQDIPNAVTAAGDLAAQAGNAAGQAGQTVANDTSKFLGVPTPVINAANTVNQAANHAGGVAAQQVHNTNTAAGNITKAAENNAKKIFSDVNAKTNIKTAKYGQVSDMLKNLTPSTYNYKPGLGMPAGPQMGVMAQDLQKSPLGSTAVSTDPQSGMKQVDYSKLFPAMTAALASHDERIRAIEAQKKKGMV